MIYLRPLHLNCPNRFKPWLIGGGVVLVLLLGVLGWFVKVLLGGPMPTHLAVSRKTCRTVGCSLKNLQEPLTQLGVLDSGGQPSKLLDAKPPKKVIGPDRLPGGIFTI